MGFTIEDALLETKNIYKIKLIAGGNGCANAMTWVQMVEDKTILQQLWGKELVVTTGLGFQNQDSLMELVQSLVKYHSVGLIVNLGNKPHEGYVFEIPQKIIDYCNEQDFPLLVVPWEIPLAELIKDFCYRCISSEKEDRAINKIIINTLINPRIMEESRGQLISHFDVDNYFQVVVVDIESKRELGMIERRRIQSQIELCLEEVAGNYGFFWFDGHFVFITNGLDDPVLKETMQATLRRAKKRIKYKIHIGIGSRMLDFRNIILSYKRALAACKMAIKFNESSIAFENMGVYQVLFTIEDQDILYSMYQQILGPIVEYDKKHHTELEETLYNYLMFDSNQKAMSEALFMHRNTINYRLNKIKEITSCDFSSFEEKMPYMLAFYIKEMIE
ncbi:MAG: PucR family transcriptional regulator [Faecalibacillus sp.]